MADQLSLCLPVGRPRLPEAIAPMLPRTAAGPFDSPDHLFEPTWGGIRALAFVEVGRDNTVPDDAGRDHAGDGPMQVRVVDEDGRDIAVALPELAALAGRLDASSAVFDGEVVVVDRLGRADPAALARRLAGRRHPPVAYLAFDLLVLDGRPLLNTPLERRRSLLRRILPPSDDAIAVPSIVGEGTALYDAAMEAGLAGVMGRVRRSPYLPGVRSRLWQFVPRRSSVGDASDPGADHGAGTDEGGPADPTVEDATGTRQPVLALIRRLPLDDFAP